MNPTQNLEEQNRVLGKESEDAGHPAANSLRPNNYLPLHTAAPLPRTSLPPALIRRTPVTQGPGGSGGGLAKLKLPSSLPPPSCPPDLGREWWPGHMCMGGAGKQRVQGESLCYPPPAFPL